MTAMRATGESQFQKRSVNHLASQYHKRCVSQFRDQDQSEEANNETVGTLPHATRRHSPDLRPRAYRQAHRAMNRRTAPRPWPMALCLAVIAVAAFTLWCGLLEFIIALAKGLAP